MHIVKYHQVRTAVQFNGSPGSGAELAGVAGSLRDLLRATGLFDSVEVEPTEDPDKLVIALCQSKPEVSDYEVALALERIWNDRIRHPFWEAHAMILESGHVELEAATKASSASHYVTVHLLATKSAIPGQRSSKPSPEGAERRVESQRSEVSLSTTPSFGGSTNR